MAERSFFPTIGTHGELVCDCDLQRLNFATGVPEAELLTVKECKEAILAAGGGDYSRPRCGVVALERAAMIGRLAESKGPEDAA